MKVEFQLRASILLLVLLTKTSCCVVCCNNAVGNLQCLLTWNVRRPESVLCDSSCEPLVTVQVPVPALVPTHCNFFDIKKTQQSSHRRKVDLLQWQIWKAGNSTKLEDEKDEQLSPSTENEKSTKQPISSALMIASIVFYKEFISPLLPPACRFLPTCSSYGIMAIQQFGPMKGFVLIIWRLLRCSPAGGRGYDPPKWPPVNYKYTSF